MDKKDIYDHLAKIYLDASNGKKKKSRFSPEIFRNFSLAGIVLAGVFVFILSGSLKKPAPYSHELALFLQPELVKINFNFDPAKKEVYSLNLNGLNVARFRALAFSAKKANYRDNIALRVEFNNAFKESSHVYFRQIPYRWREFKISLLDFKSISDWSDMSSLAFIVEEWNTKEKKGAVYIDNIRLLK